MHRPKSLLTVVFILATATVFLSSCQGKPAGMQSPPTGTQTAKTNTKADKESQSQTKETSPTSQENTSGEEILHETAPAK